MICFRILDHIFRNPYYPSASVFAKLAANISTAIWAIDVLMYKHAIGLSAYAWIEDLVGEDLIAGPLLALCLLQIVWLLAYWRPRRCGILGYFTMMVWWLFVLYSVLLNGTPQPTALMGSATAAGLSVFACLSWPRDGKPC